MLFYFIHKKYFLHPNTNRKHDTPVQQYKMHTRTELHNAAPSRNNGNARRKMTHYAGSGRYAHASCFLLVKFSVPKDDLLY